MLYKRINAMYAFENDFKISARASARSGAKLINANHLSHGNMHCFVTCKLKALDQ
jgi:hypothetical protein